MQCLFQSLCLYIYVHGPNIWVYPSIDPSICPSMYYIWNYTTSLYCIYIYIWVYIYIYVMSRIHWYYCFFPPLVGTSSKPWKTYPKQRGEGDQSGAWLFPRSSLLKNMDQTDRTWNYTITTVHIHTEKNIYIYIYIYMHYIYRHRMNLCNNLECFPCRTLLFHTVNGFRTIDPPEVGDKVDLLRAELEDLIPATCSGKVWGKLAATADSETSLW